MPHSWPAALLPLWHPVAYSAEVGSAPVAVRLLDQAIVLFRAANGIAALEDRCPHRNVPLSGGRMQAGEIACPYHGWRFDGVGQCTHIPGSGTPAAAPCVRRYAVRDDGTLIWLSIADDPVDPPPLPSQIHDAGYDSFWWPLPSSTASIADAIENLVDPVHAYFLHPGLVRKDSGPDSVAVDFRVNDHGAIARYTEPRESMTLLQRLSEGNRTVSWGRYTVPTQVQIGFEDPKGIHATITVVFSPISAQETRPFACFSTRKGMLPAWFKRWFITTFHRRVLDQDLAMLRLQAEHTARFGGPRYKQGPLDLFGPVIWAALNAQPLEPKQQQLQLVTPAVA